MDSFHPGDKVVWLSTAPDAVQAHIWGNALSDEGIYCHVVGDYLDAGTGDISGHKVEIWVRRPDVTQAQAVLRRCTQSEVEVDALA